MNLWHDVSVGKDAPEVFTSIIEISKGSMNKYEIDKETGLIALDRVMHTSHVYPIDYAFSPQTLWDDGDALDVMVLSTAPLHPGVVVHSRPVGIMRMVDSGESDDKVIAVPVDDPRWDDVKDIDDVNPHTLKEVKHFFETYKDLQGKKVEVTGFAGKEEAKEAVKRSIKLYNEKFGK